MDIASLQAFVTIAHTGSFSLAAEHLHLTQPAISKRISSLESSVATLLFDRLGRRVRLTEAGRALLPRAERILAEVDDSRRALRNLNGSVTGPLIVATSHHIGLHRLPPILRDYAERYPAVALDMRFVDSEQGCAAVLRGEAELAIVTLPPRLEAPLEGFTVWDDPLVAVCGASHPLASTSPDLAALVAYPAILPSEATFTRQILDRRCAEIGVALRLAFTSNYLETIKTMVAIGLGWTVLPASMVDDTLHPLAITLDLSRQLGAVRHREHTPSNAGQALWDLLTEASIPSKPC